ASNVPAPTWTGPASPTRRSAWRRARVPSCRPLSKRTWTLSPGTRAIPHRSRSAATRAGSGAPVAGNGWGATGPAPAADGGVGPLRVARLAGGAGLEAAGGLGVAFRGAGRQGALAVEAEGEGARAVGVQGALEAARARGAAGAGGAAGTTAVDRGGLDGGA